MLSFTWSRRTAFADGTWENGTRGGLSRLGRDAVREMNRLGMMVDVSHASDRTLWDVRETTEAPVVASHSNARALHEHPRNLTDEMIRAIAEGGGVVGAVAYPAFVGAGEVTIADWADHIDHMVRLAGVDHVGIGADFVHHLFEVAPDHDIRTWRPRWSAPPSEAPTIEGMRGPEDFPNLTAELLRRGYTREDLTRIYGANFLRVMAEVT
jgi:membrane dipeptidase